MSKSTCKRCGTSWNAATTPCCPQCLVETWLATEHFIRPKHDPAVVRGVLGCDLARHG
jgi:hypothetical protein